MSVYATALRVMEGSGRSCRSLFVRPAGAVDGAAACPCTLGAATPVRAPAGMSDVIADPLAGASATGYVVFKGLPDPSDFFEGVVRARASAVVCLGHRNAVKAVFAHVAQAGHLPLGGGKVLRCVHCATYPEGLTVRQLEVAGPGGAGEYWCNFLHLESWPDNGVPPSTQGMLRLCRQLEACRRPGARIAVQCYCGTDSQLGACPAGAFMATDMLRQRLQALHLAPIGAVEPQQVEAALDLPALIRALPAQRRALVETADQFSFIYAAVTDEIRDGLRVERRLMPLRTPGAPALGALALGGGGAPAAAATAPHHDCASPAASITAGR